MLLLYWILTINLQAIHWIVRIFHNLEDFPEVKTIISKSRLSSRHPTCAEREAANIRVVFLLASWVSIQVTEALFFYIPPTLEARATVLPIFYTRKKGYWEYQHYQHRFKPVSINPCLNKVGYGLPVHQARKLSATPLFLFFFFFFLFLNGTSVTLNKHLQTTLMFHIKPQ